MHSLGKEKGMGNLGVWRRDGVELGVLCCTRKKKETNNHLASRGTNLNLKNARAMFIFSEEEVSP